METSRFIPLFIMILLVSCSSVANLMPDSGEMDHPGNASLEKAQSLFQEGKYSEAITQYKKLTRNKQQNVAEAAQFHVAYTLAFYKNPKKDYQEAMNEFQIFVRRYPASLWKEEASNWIYLINQYLTKKSENNKLKDDIKKLVDIDIEAEQKQNRLK